MLQPGRRRATARCYAAAMKLILTWLLAACALLLVAYVYPGVEVRSFPSALIAAAVIGLFNMLLRPVLVVLTLPVTVVTLGLFLFVINALLFWSAASVLDGFYVAGFWAALLGSVIYSVLMLAVNTAVSSLLAR
jgi:putative membrane protein